MSTTRVRLMEPVTTTYIRARIFNLILVAMPFRTSMDAATRCCVCTFCSLQDFTSDLTVVSICLHYVAWVTVAVVRPWTVDAQMTARIRAFTLVNICTRPAIFHQPVPSCTVTTLKNNPISGTVADRVHQNDTTIIQASCLYLQSSPFPVGCCSSSESNDSFLPLCRLSGSCHPHLSHLHSY